MAPSCWWNTKAIKFPRTSCYNLSMIKVMFFDLGGVIFTDFFSGGERGLVEVLGQPSEEVLSAYVTTDAASYCKDQLSDENRWKSFVNALGLPESIIQTCIDEFYKSYHLFPDSLKFLEDLKKENTFRLGILSDQPMGIAKYLREKYKQVFTVCDPNLTIISAEVGLSKKDQDLGIYKLAIERSGVSPDEILFVDNSLHNAECAQSVGMQTYFFDIKNYSVKILLDGLRTRLQ